MTEGPLQRLGRRLWLGARFGVVLALLMLVLLTGYEIVTAPAGVYLHQGEVQWSRIGEYLLSWAGPLLLLNVVMGALHYSRAAHDRKEDE